MAANHALQRMGIEKPKIGLFGINPHAGENGLFGDDDERINVPAAARLRANWASMWKALSARIS